MSDEFDVFDLVRFGAGTSRFLRGCAVGPGGGSMICTSGLGRVLGLDAVGSMICRSGSDEAGVEFCRVQDEAIDSARGRLRGEQLPEPGRTVSSKKSAVTHIFMQVALEFSGKDFCRLKKLDVAQL